MSTLTASFADDVRTYAEGGVDAIGIWEMKLDEGRDDGEALALFASSGLGAATAVPLVPSILPLPLMPGPADPRERIDSLLGSINREAERVGVRLALEPFQAEGLESWSIVNTLGEAVEVIDEVGSPALGIQFDVWHLSNTPDLHAEVERYAHHFAGVHVNDWRNGTRGWADRVLPGDGVADVPAILATLERAGWDGYYDVEIFSDNGAFGTVYPDSLWDVEPSELVGRSRESFIQCWEERRVAA